MIVTTWNVLHGVHAANWGRPATAPDDEQERMEAIARHVETLPGLVVCLQEVSGDQCRALEAKHVFSAPYPRVPRVRRGAVELSDPTEHLAVVSPALDGKVLRHRVFPDDPGKGFLSVLLDNGLVVVSTHVSYGDRGRAQIAELGAHAREQAGRPVVIAGDFNAGRNAVLDALGDGFCIAELPSGRCTRPRADGDEKDQNIDHVIGYRTHADESGVEDGLGLSDHNPVWAAFR